MRKSGIASQRIRTDKAVVRLCLQLARCSHSTIAINVCVYDFTKACLKPNLLQTRMYARTVFATLIAQNNDNTSFFWSLDSDRFCEVSRLVHIRPSRASCVIRKQLQRHHMQQRA